MADEEVLNTIFNEDEQRALAQAIFSGQPDLGEAERWEEFKKLLTWATFCTVGFYMLQDILEGLATVTKMIPNDDDAQWNPEIDFPNGPPTHRAWTGKSIL